jgi:hypothetical protein
MGSKRMHAVFIDHRCMPSVPKIARWEQRGPSILLIRNGQGVR